MRRGEYYKKDCIWWMQAFFRIPLAIRDLEMFARILNVCGVDFNPLLARIKWANWCENASDSIFHVQTNHPRPSRTRFDCRPWRWFDELLICLINRRVGWLAGRLGSWWCQTGPAQEKRIIKIDLSKMFPRFKRFFGTWYIYVCSK